MTQKQIKEFDCLSIEYQNKPSLLVRTYNNPRCAVIVMDMVAGFCEKGALYSPRLKNLVDRVASALDYLPEAVKFFLNDTHTPDSLEFSSYPKHCHTPEERQIAGVLSRVKGIVIEKDSTNGIFSFLKYADVNLYDNFLIMGNCTDICVLQFALSLRAYFNEIKKTANVLVFTDYVDTFDSPLHNAELMQVFALKNMEQSGVKIFKNLV
ncbi:MAG TPA: cysteine hydrolase [Clostridiales bacterium]|nr:cysteine hydrolase [Clostridiales bacterium]